MRTSRAMTEQFGGLAQPPAPSNIAATVMARIARLEMPALREDAPLPSGQSRPVRVGWNGWVSAACLTTGVLTVGATSGANGIGKLTWSLRPGMEDLIIALARVEKNCTYSPGARSG
jgi:hypothetical protein